LIDIDGIEVSQPKDVGDGWAKIRVSYRGKNSYYFVKEGDLTEKEDALYRLNLCLAVKELGLESF
jgi:hypothetical protein